MASKGSKKKAAATDKMEWIIAALGMIMLSAALGFILYRAVTHESKSADLLVSIERVERSEQGYRVDFLVTNSGTQTAAAVIIEGALLKEGQNVETSNAMLAYAPANSTRRGGMYFTNDPNQYKMTIRAVGFEKP